MRVESTYPPRALKERIARLSGPARCLHFDIRYTIIQHEASFTCTSSPGRVFLVRAREGEKRASGCATRCRGSVWRYPPDVGSMCHCLAFEEEGLSASPSVCLVGQRQGVRERFPSPHTWSSRYDLRL